MESIIIAAPPETIIENLICSVSSDFSIEKQSEDRYLIFSKTSHCWIGCDDSVKSYFDDEELSIVTKYIKTPIFFVCEFSDIDFGKEILSYIINDEKYVVDNDHGDIMTGKEFVKRLKNEPHWDWRIDPARQKRTHE